MSIPVGPDELAAAVAERGSGYLLSVDGDGAVKAVTVEPSVRRGAVVIAGASRGTSRNLAANPRATVLLPPAEHHGHTLLIDGEAHETDDGFELRPDSAVLHRPASHADASAPGGSTPSASACGDDCVPISDVAPARGEGA